MMKLQLVVILLCVVTRVRGTDIVVETPLGSVTGELDTSVGVMVEAFRGIPFAKPPVDERRFTLPEPFGEFGDLDATYYRPGCIQSFMRTTENTSEDCLHLNIFRRQDLETDGLVPVIVMIHGGSFAFGSTQEFSYNGVPLAAYSDVIVVTIQYRLGVFGFAYSDLIPGNIGLYDQKLAIEWVHDNIQYFGGDNQQITLMGVSAGSMSISAHIISAETRGRNLFQSVIMDAGVISAYVVSPEETSIRTQAIAEKVGCPISGEAMLACLRKADAEELVEDTFKPEAQLNLVRFVPITDGHYLPTDLKGDLEENSVDYANVRMLIGTARDEGSLVVGLGLAKSAPKLETDDEFMDWCAKLSLAYNYNLDFSNETIRNSVKEMYLAKYNDSVLAASGFIGDIMFFCPVNAFIKEYSKKRSDIFVYQFNRVLKKSYQMLDPTLFGAFHWSPHIHFTGCLLAFSDDVDGNDREYFLDSILMISTFAKGEPPAFRGVVWPDFTTTNEILSLDEQSEPVIGLQHEDECRTVFSDYDSEAESRNLKSEL